MIEKLIVPFELLSDPDGTVAIRPYGFWDAGGGFSRPAVVLTDAAGTVRFIYEGRDFADRPKEEIVLEAIESHGSR